MEIGYNLDEFYKELLVFNQELAEQRANIQFQKDVWAEKEQYLDNYHGLKSRYKRVK